MSLPSEFVMEGAVSSIGDVIIYRAEHPIHGAVSVYQPDNNLPPDLAEQVKKRLYQSGLRMRDMSLQNLRFVTKSLEVSQNPNEPYIVTQYTKYDLEDLVNNGVILNPKRMFVILSQVLEAIVTLAANGWRIDSFRARQVKLPQLYAGNISLTVFEDMEEGISLSNADTATAVGRTGNSDTETTPQSSPSGDASTEMVGAARGADENQVLKAAVSSLTEDYDAGPTAVLEENVSVTNTQERLRAVQRNIYILGDITYQLLFGRKYQAGDKLSVANIRKLGGRWRKALEKALSEDIERRYGTYEDMLRDVRKASNRNKRLAVASIPFLIVLVVIAGYFAHERYRRYKIMTSEAGQTIESFLGVINETKDEFPELKKPETESAKPDEETILRAFNKIEPADED